MELRRGSISIGGGETAGLECGPQTRRRAKEEEETGKRCPETCEAVETSWDEPNNVEKEEEEAGSPSGQSGDGTHSYAGGKGHMDVNSGAPAAGERKFDIRTWVLVTGWDPLEAFVFDESYLRVCPRNFTLDESKFAEPQVHLTNLSARRAKKGTAKAAWDGRSQRQETAGRRRRRSAPSASAFGAGSGDIGGVLDATDAAASEAETEDFVASQAELIQRLGEVDGAGGSGEKSGRGEEGVRARGERLWRTRVSPSIEGVVRRTLLAARPHVRPREASFQLFGFDLLLDRQLRPCELTDQALELRREAPKTSGDDIAPR